MKRRVPGKIRQSQRQKLSFRLMVATGVAVSVITLVLVIYFQFFQNEVIKAQKPVILTQDELPVSLEITEIVAIPADTNVRNGVRYKVAKPLPQNPTVE